MRRILLLLPTLCALAWCTTTWAGDDKGTEVKFDKLTSKTPARVLTAMCSATMPLYSSGMSQPPNGTM